MRLVRIFNVAFERFDGYSFSARTGHLLLDVHAFGAAVSQIQLVERIATAASAIG